MTYCSTDPDADRTREGAGMLSGLKKPKLMHKAGLYQEPHSVRHSCPPKSWLRRAGRSLNLRISLNNKFLLINN